MAWITFLSALSLLTPCALAVQYLGINGSDFITQTDGDRFSIIGVDYQPGGSSGLTTTADPLSDPTACLRDAILMQLLGINTIRVYNLDSGINHDECASIFNAAGIYMLLDVNSGLEGTYLNRADPSSTYTLEYLEHVFSIIEAFAYYPNILGFFSGNEIINQNSSYDAPAYIRAVTRDMKEYIANNIPRDIGVGYSAADVETMLADTFQYLSCNLENSTDSNIDFFGLNDYEWCGDSSFTESGYNVLVELFAGTAIPVFFSEYGCNAVAPRTFTNVPVLYGPEMQELSGGLVYEWTEDSSDYGLVEVNSTTVVTLLVDYTNLQIELDQITLSLLTAVNKTAEAMTETLSCAASLITESSFMNYWSIPSRPSGADAIVTSGLSSKSTGAQTAVTATTMPATVYNYTGAEVTGLALKVLDEDDDNAPGLASTYTATGYTGSVTMPSGTSGASATSSSGSGKKSAGSTTVPLPEVSINFMSVLLVSVFFGAIVL